MRPASDFRVTLLGTGTPMPRPDRFGPSTLIEAGDEKLLIDAGRGAALSGCTSSAWHCTGSMASCSRTITPTTSPAFPTCGSRAC